MGAAPAGRARSAGRVATAVEDLELFAASLAADDRVVLVDGQPTQGGRVRARHRGAHRKDPRRAKPRGRPGALLEGLHFATSVTRTQRKTPTGEEGRPQEFDFHPYEGLCSIRASAAQLAMSWVVTSSGSSSSTTVAGVTLPEELLAQEAL